MYALNIREWKTKVVIDKADLGENYCKLEGEPPEIKITLNERRLNDGGEYSVLNQMHTALALISQSAHRNTRLKYLEKLKKDFLAGKI